jgi:subtilisin family serine protease
VEISGHATGGRVRVEGLSFDTGTVDLYTPIDGTYTSPMPFSDHLVEGRLTDHATTNSAIVVGAHVLQNYYFDVNGNFQLAIGEGGPGELWLHSSGGPTRDGRLYGVDISAPGHNSFAAYAQESYWATFMGNLAEDGDGWYGRGGATSGSAPMVVGGIALLLEQFPNLTAEQIRDVLRATATTDQFTGVTPNPDWGYGKLNVLAALDSLHAVPEPSTLIYAGCGLFGLFIVARRRCRIDRVPSMDNRRAFVRHA